MDKRDEIIAKCIKDMQLATNECVKLTELSMKMANELKEIDEEGMALSMTHSIKLLKLLRKLINQYGNT